MEKVRKNISGKILILGMFILFIISGCAMNNPYLKVNSNEKLEFKNTNNILYFFITNEKKKIVKRNKDFAPDAYSEETRMSYRCDKKLVSSDLKTGERLLSFFAFSIFGFISYLFPSMKIDTITNNKLSISDILILEKNKFKMIDETLNYKSKEEFIKNINKIDGAYFITIDLYDIDNVPKEYDKNYIYTHYYVYNIYACIGAFDVYKSSAKKFNNLVHYQDIFYPERFRTGESTSVFETIESVSMRRVKTLSKKLEDYLLRELKIN